MSQQHPSLPITVPLPVPVKVSNIVFSDMPVSITQLAFPRETVVLLMLYVALDYFRFLIYFHTVLPKTVL